MTLFRFLAAFIVDVFCQKIEIDIPRKLINFDLLTKKLFLYQFILLKSGVYRFRSFGTMFYTLRSEFSLRFFYWDYKDEICRFYKYHPRQ